MIAVFKHDGKEIGRHGTLDVQPMRLQHVIVDGTRYEVKRVTLDTDTERGILLVDLEEVNTLPDE